MGRPSFQRDSGEPFERISLNRSSRIARISFGSMFLTLLLTLQVTAQNQTGSFGVFTSPSRDMQKPGGGEPIQIIAVPQFPMFPDCPLDQEPSDVRSNLLDEKGPQFPPLYSFSSLAVMGFSRGDWPVAIDYVLEQDSLLLVVISPEGEIPLVYRLEGKKGHWMTKIQIPPSVGKQLRVSQYLVQTLEDGVGLVSSSHVHIHGIAAGPKAVGSIGIDQVSFTPARIQLVQHQKAEFSYHSISDFDDTEVSIVRVGKTGTGEIVAAGVRDKSMGSIAQNHVKNGDWDGSVNTEEIAKNFSADVRQWLLNPHGQHILQVRAWLRKDHGGDFVTALSETLVDVE